MPRSKNARYIPSARPEHRHGRRVTYHEYMDMWRLYKEEQNADFVALHSRINRNTVLKYINRGDPARAKLGFIPLKVRWDMFREGAEFREDVQTRDLLRLRSVQHSNLVNAAYEAMRGNDPERQIDLREKRMIETSTQCPECKEVIEIAVAVMVPKVDPDLFMRAVDKELKLYREREARERDSAASGTEVVKVDLEDPRAKIYLRDQMKRMMGECIQGGVRETIMALDPDNSQGLVDKLPMSLQIMYHLDYGHPDFKTHAESLARRFRMTGSIHAMEETHDLTEQPKAEEPALIEEPIPEEMR